MGAGNWREDELQLITVALIEMGFERYRVQITVGNAVQPAVTMWARSEDDIRRNVRAHFGSQAHAEIAVAVRSRFWAEKRINGAYVSKETKETLNRYSMDGDWIVWPEYAERAQEKAS